MKFTISRADMEYGVGLVAGAVDKKRLGDFAGSIRINALGSNKIELQATDMELWAAVDLGASVDVAGTVVLPADKIASVIKMCGAGDVAFVLDAELKTIIDGTLASYEISGLAPDEYPTGYGDDVQEMIFGLHAGKMPACVHSVYHAVSNDATKPNICGVHFSLSETGRLTVAATDGHRLSMAAMELPGECIYSKFRAHDITIPAKTALLLSKINRSLDIGRVPGKNRLYFHSESITVCSAETTLEYPDFKRIIPTGPGEVISVCTAQFIEALESCCVMSDDQFRSVHLRVSGEKIHISALGVNNTARASIQCLSDCEIKICCNSRYLIQALKSIDSDEVFIKYFGPGSPFMLIPADHKNWDERMEIIVPLRGE